MNTPSPLNPQGSINEPKPRTRSNIIIAVFAILAFHVVLLGALLLQGCKDKPSGVVRDTPGNLDSQLAALTNPAPTSPLDTTSPSPYSMTPMASNTTAMTPVAPPALPPVATPAMPPITIPGDFSAPPVAASAAGTTEHTIAKGESFYTLSKKYGVSLQAIVQANAGVDSKKLQLGQKVKIPEKTVAAAPTTTGDSTTALTIRTTTTSGGADVSYVVKRGDSLTKIAKANNTTTKQIKSANNLRTDMIRVGQKLKIPGKTAAAPATMETAPPVVPAITPPAAIPPASMPSASAAPSGAARNPISS
jgi:LysM repeat protein